MSSIQVPVLALTSEHITKLKSVPTTTFDAEQCFSGPVVFNNFSQHMNGMKDHFHEFSKRLQADQDKAKKENKGVAPRLGRVVDGVSEQVAGVVQESLTAAFSAKLPGWGKRTMVGPCFPDELKDTSVPEELKIQFWASGPLVEATATSRFHLGSFQYVSSGSRSFAAVKYSSWLTFLRNRAKTTKPADKDRDAAQATADTAAAPLTLGAAKEVTPKEARERFRELTADRLV